MKDADPKQTPIKVAMMVDDEPVDHMTFERIVKRSGLVETLISFSGAQDALEYLMDPDNPKVDALFLDINMPRMDGFEFLEAATDQLGPRFVRSSFIMLTNELGPVDRARAERFEVVHDFITKPLRVEQLQKVALMLEEGALSPTQAIGAFRPLRFAMQQGNQLVH